MGPVRVLWLEPARTVQRCCATAAIVGDGIGAGVTPRATGLGGGAGIYRGRHFGVTIQLIADVVVGFGLRGLALQDQLAYFATPAGNSCTRSCCRLYAGASWLLAPVNAHLPPRRLSAQHERSRRWRTRQRRCPDQCGASRDVDNRSPGTAGGTRSSADVDEDINGADARVGGERLPCP